MTMYQSGNPHPVERIAAVTSTKRTRSEEKSRAANNGGSVAEHLARLDQAVKALERRAAEIEKALG